MFHNQCSVVHKNLLAGTCPWCGCAIIKGNIASLPPHGFGAAVRMLTAESAEPDPRDVLATDYLLAIIEDCGPQAFKAIPLLRAALKDRDWSVRLAAVNALGRMGPSAKPALSELHLLLQDEDQLVRDAADEAIKNIGK